MRVIKEYRKQRGSTLFIALTFLVVITLMGLSGMQTATLQERMAGGERDYSIALQVAEMTLRDAEHDLLGVDYTNTPIPGLSDAGASCNPNSIGRVCFEKKQTNPTINLPSRPLQSIAGFGANNGLWTVTCQWGQCYISTNADAPKPAVYPSPIWTDQSIWENDALTSSNTVGSSVVYGSFTGAPRLSMPQQPRYIIESLNNTGSINTPASANSSVLNFRITARATGLNPRTVVLLQEVFQCSNC